MKKAILALALVASTSAFALDIKGLQVDKPINCDLMSFAISQNEWNSCGRQLEWTGAIEFLGKETPILVTQTKKGVLSSIVLTNFNYEQAVRAMKLQFGESYTVGPNEKVWTKGNQSIRIMRHVGLGPMLVYAGKAAESH